MCDKISRLEKRDTCKDDNRHICVNASFITKKSCFRFIKGCDREEWVPLWPAPHRCIYPKADAYYAFHEDTNPFTRFPSKCQSRKYGNVRPHYEPVERPYEIRDPYYEPDARRKYLERTPTCFAIFGKPDKKTTKLAAMIAETWNCVLISPATLLEQELVRETEKGNAIINILKSGGILGPDVVMNLIESRINKRDVLHRGYVVEGLPLIQNQTLDYSSYPTSAEEDEVNNLVLYFKQLFDSSFHRICGQATGSEDTSSLSSDSQSQESLMYSDRTFQSTTCTSEPNYERYIATQIEHLFTTWPIKPSIIIHVTCPDADFVRKREYFRLDPLSGRVVDTSIIGISRNIETVLSHDRTEIDMNVSFELYQELIGQERLLVEDQAKYLLKRVSDGKSNVEAQCKLYKCCATPTIEKWIVLHKPENVIRVDARLPLSRMFQTVIARLRTLPIPRVTFPKTFTDITMFEGESVAAIAPEDEFEGKSIDEVFQSLTNRETVSPLYPWKLSSWNSLCPVELTRGTTVEGLPKHVVRFMNNIFFFSSEEAVNLFIENPRTFLIPFSPRPTCKMAVFGPKYSGKSQLSEKLAQAFAGTVVNVNEVIKSLVDVDLDSFFSTPIYSSMKENIYAVIKKIQNIPKEEIDIEVWRDGGYIMDGMYPDIDSWIAITGDSNIIFEDVILLFDEEPYEYLLSKWHSIHDAADSRTDLEEYGEHFKDMNAYEDRGDEEEAPGELIEYLRHIQQFQLDWEEIRERVENTCKNLITCNLSQVKDVPKFVIEKIKDRYADKARVMTDDEKERERDIAEYMAMTDDTENVEEDEAEEAEAETMELDVKEDYRRLGDTNDYCPVALLNYNILCKGKEDFSAIFMNKIYLLSSAAALEEFIQSPKRLSLPFYKPLSKIPPCRFSIFGSTGSGKSTLANGISREYGLVHVNYLYNFTTFMKDRGMKPVCYRSVLTSPEDLVEAVDLPEDHQDEKYNSHEATVQTFIRRYWKTGGVLTKKMLRECLLIFFEGLYDVYGAVLDHYPSCPEDIEAASQNYTMPEVIIELRCSRYTTRERIIPILFNLWKILLDKKKRIEEKRYQEEAEEYETNRDAWVNKILDEEFCQSSLKHRPSLNSIYENDLENDEQESDVGSIDSRIMELRQFELEEIWRREKPPPILFTDWEDFETVKERIEKQFEEAYENDFQKVEATRIALEKESIPYTVINGERSEKEVLLQVMRILTPYVNRDTFILEKVYTIDLETAELLLDCGYYLLSSFGRWCPVQLYENKVSIQMFLPLEAEQEIYPVIHRQFIYFLGGKDAHVAFRKDPLVYLEQDSCAPIIPFRLSIIGPPKCGKTTLARRFAKKYGLKVVTRGTALRHTLRCFPWTETAQFAESRLRAGHIVPEKTLSRAVEMYSVDPLSMSQGFVLDGFPSNCKEFEELTYLGLQPMVILDLKASLEFCLYCLSRGNDVTKKPLNFSKKFLVHRYKNWAIDQENFGNWLRKFRQNVIELDASRSMWYIWTRADEEVCMRYTHIRRYFRECDYDKVHSLKYMSVSPYEFTRRQSQYECYCPLCLFHENITRISGPPPNHQGMVQFREHYYWICPQHLSEFMENPEKHLPPINTAQLPKDRPRVLTEIVDKEHSCWSRRLKVAGFCLVTYVDNLPKRDLIPGKVNIGVIYKDNVYLFCTEECRDKFLLQSENYASIDVKFTRTMNPIDIKGLPDLGFLEQTVIKKIVHGLTETCVVRPKIVGLSPSATAAVFLGLFLKINNVSCALGDVKIYKRVYDRVFSRDRILKVAVRTMKKRINPYIHIPVHRDRQSSQFRENNFLSARGLTISFLPVRRVPVPDTRFDYLCEYFKPASKVPAFLNVVDIAGLVKGAAEGQGLGNSFLSHINACDGIFHLCRAFDDDDVTHVEGDVNPVRDLEIISEELRLKDIEFLNGHLEKLEKLVVRGNDKKLKPEYDTLLKVKGVMVDEKNHIRFADWSATDIEVLNKYLFLTSKPVIYLVNLSEKDYIRKKNKWLIKIKEWVDKNDPGAILIPFSGAFENKIIDMNEAERNKYLEENKVTSALDKIIVQGYKALLLQYFFTAGHDEVKAWTIQKGTKAPQAAGKIHTDFEKGFIMAEVMKYDDFKNEGSEAAVKAAGKYRQQGRNYVVEDGDIIFFKFNAGAGLKDAKKK